MNNQDFTTMCIVDQTPHEAFNAITNVRGWWSEDIEGQTAKLNDEFSYHYEDVHYCQVRLIEVIPDQKVVWLIKYNYFKFTKDRSEWTGTTVSFDITQKDHMTQIRMTHHGLVPEYECYDICSNAWTHYIQDSLKDLITTGKGKPNSSGNPQTPDEKRLSES